ncbi:f-box domain cyclin-like [Apiospora kogelbergensis]|uniref:F-box domain cyclin-like n=2 Tax=Apiospora kogelbergensis TaxID=1337665 RepID=A0AAW0R2Z3_9PEZI
MPYASSSIPSTNLNDSPIACKQREREMDKLSFEVVSLILDNLPDDDEYGVGPKLAPYATISRTWQAAVEARTFARVTVRNLDHLQPLFSPSTYRPAALRELAFEVHLPVDSESRAHHRQNQSAVLAAFTSLLGQLAACEAQPSNGGHVGPIKLRIGFLGPDGDVFLDRTAANKRYLEFPGEEVGALAAIRSVSWLILAARCGGRGLHPGTACQLATRFSDLQRLELHYWDPALKRPAQRKANRSKLAAGIKNLDQLPRLSRLSIVRNGGFEPANHGFENTGLEYEAAGSTVDLLCEALRDLASKGALQELELRNELISPDLFRNRRQRQSAAWGDQQQEQEEWPSLKRLEIDAPIVAPSGKWYYTGEESDVATGPPWVPPPDLPPHPYGADENCDSAALSDADMDDVDRDAEANGVQPARQWRTRPDPEAFNRLANDLLAAVNRMPRLKNCAFGMSPFHDRSVSVEIQCVEPGEAFLWNVVRIDNKGEVEYHEENLAVRRIEIHISYGTRWEVPEEVGAKCAEWVGSKGEVAVLQGGRRLY